MLGSIIAVITALIPRVSLIVGIAKQINWKIAAPTIAMVFALGFAYYKGYSEAEQHSKAKQLTEQLAEAKAQLVRLNNARVDAEKRTMDIEASNLELQHKVTEYVAYTEKASDKGGACRLSRADLSRLRDLAK